MITILLISEQGRLSYQVHSFSSHALALPYPPASQPVRSSVSSSAPSRLLNQLRATMTRKDTLKTLAHPDERTYQTTTKAMSTKECAIHHRDSPRESHNDICLSYLLHTHIYLCVKSADIKGDPASQFLSRRAVTAAAAAVAAGTCFIQYGFHLEVCQTLHLSRHGNRYGVQ